MARRICWPACSATPACMPARRWAWPNCRWTPRSKSSWWSRSASGMTEVPQHPAYGQLRPVTGTASVLLANNPGKMTLEGTNTWVLRAPGSDQVVVVDPGPDDDEHIAAVAGVGRIALMLISHRHGDQHDANDK